MKLSINYFYIYILHKYYMHLSKNTNKYLEVIFANIPAYKKSITYHLYIIVMTSRVVPLKNVSQGLAKLIQYNNS